MVDIKIPAIGESIKEVTLLKWLKKTGDFVERDVAIAEIESEKATVEVNAEQSGILKTIAAEGDTVEIGALIGTIDTAATPHPTKDTTPSPNQTTQQKSAKPISSVTTDKPSPEPPIKSVNNPSEIKATPLASAIMKDNKIEPSQIPVSDTHKIKKQDILNILKGKQNSSSSDRVVTNRREKMSALRKTISKRLVEAKNTTAMLTTFNEVDMTEILKIRSQYKDTFKEQHGVGLGFMSFFTKASSIALLDFPAVNAFIDQDSIEFHDYTHISIAVSTPRGLTVPIIRNVQNLSFADIEKKIIELSTKAKDNKLTADELQGGTFTITNGGVFGSLLSTPIINLPQSAILGMHKIQERPVAVNGKVEIRPMMYLALSYDHRIIDGKESVSFLVRVKSLLENPLNMLTGQDPTKVLLDIQ